MDDANKLRDEVNPIHNTAKATLELQAKAGDADSLMLYKRLGLGSVYDKSMTDKAPREMVEDGIRLYSVFMTHLSTRFNGMNGVIASMPERIVIDLPCGLTARGIKMSREGRNYHGFDLPAVIDVVGPLMAELCNGDANIHYDAVDATNHDSMEAALTDEDRNLLIVTEGLLSYFSQSELEEMFSAIRRLLMDHGGSWVIADVAYHVQGQAMADAILDGQPKAKAMYAAYMAKGSGDMAGVKAFDNDLFTGTEDDARAFVERMGFDVRELCVADYLPDHLPWLDSLPGAEARVRDVFAQTHLWELIPREDAEDAQEPVEDLPFAIDVQRADGTLTAVVQGRLDTITAPELLERFQAVGAGVDAIVVDAKRLSYVSSAGLRVLMKMLKSVGDASAFKMVNVGRGVREVLEVSGFDQFFL